MTCMTKYLLFAFLGCAVFGAPAPAQTINAASCSEPDVLTALGKVTADGAVVNIPAGTCTWTNAVNYTTTHAMSIIGAGSQAIVGGGDVTVIIDGLPYTGPDPALLHFTANGTSFRLSGLTFRGSGGSSCTVQTYNGAFELDGTSTQVRVDHVHFAYLDARAFTVGGAVNGVFDHNLGDGCTGAGYMIYASSWNGDTQGFGDKSWADFTYLGSSKFIFFENNTFNDFGNDSTQGGRWVERFNTFTLKRGTGALQTHPTGGSPRNRGSRAWEVYGNTFADPTSTANNVFWLSSGTGVVWGNSAPTGFENLISIHSMRKDNSTYTQVATPTGWGYCGTSFDGKGSAWDQNTNTTTGARCLDQPGNGKGDLLTNNFPNAVNTTTGTIAWPHQALEPVYEWLDTWAQVQGYPNGALVNNYQPTEIIENQNYYVYTSGFNGKSGVGSGLLSARPATCTAGVAFWAIDQGNWNQSGIGGQGELFVCSATNTWTLYYTPYTYPHPLTRGTKSGNLPAAPTGLAAIVQ